VDFAGYDSRLRWAGLSHGLGGPPDDLPSTERLYKPLPMLTETSGSTWMRPTEWSARTADMRNLIRSAPDHLDAYHRGYLVAAGPALKSVLPGCHSYFIMTTDCRRSDSSTKGSRG